MWLIWCDKANVDRPNDNLTIIYVVPFKTCYGKVRKFVGKDGYLQPEEWQGESEFQSQVCDVQILLGIDCYHIPFVIFNPQFYQI
jgi:hypothetical protein